MGEIADFINECFKNAGYDDNAYFQRITGQIQSPEFEIAYEILTRNKS